MDALRTFAVVLGAAAVGCSSGSAGLSPDAPAGSGDDAGGVSPPTAEAGVDEDWCGFDKGGIVAGASGCGPYQGGAQNLMPQVNGTCPTLTGPITYGTKVTYTANWMQTAGTNAGSGVVSTWMLGTFTLNGTKTMGTTHVCASITPPVVLNAVGAMAEGVPDGQTGRVWALIPNSTWALSSMPTFDGGGTWSGFAVGSTVTTDAVLSVIGLNASDPLNMESTPWPWQKGYSIPAADITDPDGDGKPGYTAPFDPASGFYPALSSAVMGEAVDKVYLVTRTMFSTSGTVQAGCVDVTGTVTPTHQESAVVGCHLKSGSDCTVGTAGSQAGYVESGNSILNLTGSGSFHTKLLTSAATCQDVLTALP